MMSTTKKRLQEAQRHLKHEQELLNHYESQVEKLQAEQAQLRTVRPIQAEALSRVDASLASTQAVIPELQTSVEAVEALVSKLEGDLAEEVRQTRTDELRSHLGELQAEYNGLLQQGQDALHPIVDRLVENVDKRAVLDAELASLGATSAPFTAQPPQLYGHAVMVAQNAVFQRRQEMYAERRRSELRKREQEYQELHGPKPVDDRLIKVSVNVADLEHIREAEDTLNRYSRWIHKDSESGRFVWGVEERGSNAVNALRNSLPKGVVNVLRNEALA